MARAADSPPAHGPHSGRWIALTAAMTVLVIAAAAVVTVALAHSHSGTGGTAARARGPVQPSRQAGSTPPAAVTPATAVAGASRIAVAPAAAGSPHAHAVVSFLTRYFAAINTHDYAAYRRLFSLAIRSGLSRPAFAAGYGTSRDSLARLRSIGASGPGQLDAVVTFTSHQRPGQSPSQSSCTLWRISLYLVREGNGYLLQTPPSGYRASFRACS